MELPYGDLECLVWYVILARYLACVENFFDRVAVLRMVLGVAHWLSSIIRKIYFKYYWIPLQLPHGDSKCFVVICDFCKLFGLRKSRVSITLPFLFTTASGVMRAKCLRFCCKFTKQRMPYTVGVQILPSVTVVS